MTEADTPTPRYIHRLVNDAAKNAHLVPSEYQFARALCGREPGIPLGWRPVENSAHPHPTCPKCDARLRLTSLSDHH